MKALLIAALIADAVWALVILSDSAQSQFAVGILLYGWVMVGLFFLCAVGIGLLGQDLFGNKR